MKVAILYQAEQPPSFDGIVKPMKDGGYSDSGADIALALVQNNIEVVTPNQSPNIENDFDWVFPDTKEGIELAILNGAEIIWLNTVLYTKHPITKFLGRNLYIVGQHPKSVEKYDDKYFTNNFLREKFLPIPDSDLINQFVLFEITRNFPVVLKPIRGRGSQGVSVVHNIQELEEKTNELISTHKFGNRLILEEYLPGEEITISIMPPGRYSIKGKNTLMEVHWSLPPVLRFNHVENIAPYSGVEVVTRNSCLLPVDQLESKEIRNILGHCECAAKLIKAKAPIRIDCRKNKNGKYYIFDVNLKPNMTGSSRWHRSDQDSLTTIAAKAIGWSYPDLINNILHQYWKL